MKRLIFALSLAFLVGFFALTGSTTHAYAFNNSSDQAQLTASGSYRTVDWHRHHYWRDDRDFDRPYVRYYSYDYYDPYYYGYPYPYTYYYGPGFSINIPFFGINVP
jgi:hypothetical protein